MLAKVADIELWVFDDGSGIELFVPEDAAEQGRFAGAVSADEADLGVAHDGAFCIFHQDLVAVVFGGVSNLQQDGHSNRGKASGTSEINLAIKTACDMLSTASTDTKENNGPHERDITISNRIDRPVGAFAWHWSQDGRAAGLSFIASP